MDDWKVIRRSVKAGQETVTRSLRLPKELDEWCSQQGNASDYIRELIRKHRETYFSNELTEDEEAIRVEFLDFYLFVKGTWSKKDIEAGITYPAPEKITDEQLDELIDHVLKHYAEFEFAEKCKEDKAFFRTVYAKIRKYELVTKERAEQQERKQREREQWAAEHPLPQSNP